MVRGVSSGGHIESSEFIQILWTFSVCVFHIFVLLLSLLLLLLCSLSFCLCGMYRCQQTPMMAQSACRLSHQQFWRQGSFRSIDCSQRATSLHLSVVITVLTDFGQANRGVRGVKSERCRRQWCDNDGVSVDIFDC